MPIMSVAADVLEQRCASCGTINRIPMAGLQLGDNLPGGPVNPDVIRLPACRCGAGELLIRTWDDHPGDKSEPRNLHRRTVNALAELLRGKGQSNSGARTQHEDEGRRGVKPPDLGELPVKLPWHPDEQKRALAEKIATVTAQAQRRLDDARAALAQVDADMVGARAAADAAHATQTAAQRRYQQLADGAAPLLEQVPRLAEDARQAGLVAALARVTRGADVDAADRVASAKGQLASQALVQAKLAEGGLDGPRKDLADAVQAAAAAAARVAALQVARERAQSGIAAAEALLAMVMSGR